MIIQLFSVIILFLLFCFGLVFVLFFVIWGGDCLMSMNLKLMVKY